MNLHLTLTPLISLIAGILVLIMPRLLNYIVAIYLIVIIGVLLAGFLMDKHRRPAAPGEAKLTAAVGPCPSAPGHPRRSPR